MNFKTALFSSFALFAAAMPFSAQSEPYIAVAKGMQCSACHSNPAGGGKRNAYGNVYAQMELAADRAGAGADAMWNGQVLSWLSVGGNLRAGFDYVDTPNQEESSEFNVKRGTVYAEAHMIPDRLSIYVDQQYGPGSSINREAYVRINSESRKAYLMAGQFFLPYGLRLQDDTAFIRRVSGVNFFNPDRGLLVGYESGPWSTQLSISNGSGGAGDSDTGKQLSFIANYVAPRFRAGASFNVNDSDVGDRQMQNLFGGLRTGPVAWLAEVDLITDTSPGQGDTDALAALAEANWLLRKGHNLKFSYDYFDPDRDVSEDHQVRYSLLWEFTPIQFLQARLGLRIYDGIPQSDFQNRDEAFVEIHGFF